MSHLANSIDTSGDLLIQRWQNGVKLIRPEKTSRHHISVVQALQSPPFLMVYFYDRHHIFQNVNEVLANTNGFESVQDAIGKSMFAVAKRKCAQQFVANNVEVLGQQKIMMVEEELKRKDEINLFGLSIKVPCYNEAEEVVGIFGCSFVLDTQPLSESLLHVMKLGLLDSQGFNNKQFLPGREINGVRLSQRETECLRLYIRGKPAKTIAAILGLSQRTVENYLARIKDKLGVYSKSELIDLTFDYFT